MTNEPTGPRTYAAAHFALELNGVEGLGVFRSIEGGGVKADVMTYQNGGTYDRWRQLGKPKFEDITLQVGMAMSEPFYKWIEDFFKGIPARKNGAIVAADFYYKEQARREFSDAMIKELKFPGLNANDKNTTYMSISLGVEDIKFKKGGGGALPMGGGSKSQKAWKACNFIFSLDGFECCKKVVKVEGFSIKQNLIEYAAGGRRSVAKSPSGIDYPQISFALPEPDAGPLIEHFKLRGVDGEVPGRLGGSIETFDNEKTTKFTLQFTGADITNIQPDKSDSSSEEAKMVKVDLYTEGMTFTYSGGGNASTK